MKLLLQTPASFALDCFKVTHIAGLCYAVDHFTHGCLDNDSFINSHISVSMVHTCYFSRTLVIKLFVVRELKGLCIASDAGEQTFTATSIGTRCLDSCGAHSWVIEHVMTIK